MPAPLAPPNVPTGVAVDVSFLVGMLIDKFRCQLPLHRRDRHLADIGIRWSRGSMRNRAGAILVNPVNQPTAPSLQELSCGTSSGGGRHRLAWAFHEGRPQTRDGSP